MVLEVSAAAGEPILSRPVGWRRSVALSTGAAALQTKSPSLSSRCGSSPQAFDAAGRPLCLVCMHRAPAPAGLPPLPLVFSDLFCAGRACLPQYVQRTATDGYGRVREGGNPVAVRELCAGGTRLCRFGVSAPAHSPVHPTPSALAPGGERRLRKELFKWERGVCQACGVDMHALCERIKVLPRVAVWERS